MKYCFVFGLLVASLHAFAGEAEWKRLKEVLKMNTAHLSYSYKVCLFDQQSGKNIDCLSGKMYTDNINVLDSNSSYIKVVNATTTLNLDRERKQALLISNKKRSNARFARAANTLLDVAEIVGKKQAIISSTKSANGGEVFLLKFEKEEIFEIEVTISRKSTVDQIMMKQRQQLGPARGVVKVLYMSDFDTVFPSSIVNVDRFVEYINKKPKLLSVYSSYQLQQQQL